MTAVLVYVAVYVVAILPGLRLGFALFGRKQAVVIPAGATDVRFGHTGGRA